MNIKASIIQSFARWILGGVPFASMKRIVADWNNEDLTGVQKREQVLREFALLGYALSGWLMNLGLELAVAWLKNQGQARE
ncbi:MAG: hypothetical protein PSU93_09390 [Methylobacter sp.]|uniref:Uncharacterized protein n=1 Tax=Candidatus Methylobacter titanis TaxID=3053457 RepID=A0AA43Q7W6_9GAMM|nr:hypothetical protein [Candidatus Methylobacter titanis]